MRAPMTLGAAAILLSSAAWLWTVQPSMDNQEEPTESSRAATSSAEAGLQTMAQEANPLQDFQWPSGSEVPVIRKFNNPSERWLPGHRGVDLGMSEAADIKAAASGTVVYAGRLSDRNVVSIEHQNGLRTTYEPVIPTVKKGESVARGQVIGQLDSGHLAGSWVLHWGAKYSGDRYINPLSLLDYSPIRLWE
ncbi:M23 family metallopeptidase [Ancrocorticia populi]|uniref:M23 family metallopeptidase n=1 Tax=Ancrocorticia populi TaxID=2175228 RepID=UPI003F99AA0A